MQGLPYLFGTILIFTDLGVPRGLLAKVNYPCNEWLSMPKTVTLVVF